MQLHLTLEFDPRIKELVGDGILSARAPGDVSGAATKLGSERLKTICFLRRVLSVQSSDAVYNWDGPILSVQVVCCNDTGVWRIE